MRGSGHALYPALSTMIGTCAFRIIWICTVFKASHTLPMLYHAFPLSWAVTIVLVGLGFLIIRPLKMKEPYYCHAIGGFIKDAVISASSSGVSFMPSENQYCKRLRQPPTMKL